MTMEMYGTERFREGQKAGSQQTKIEDAKSFYANGVSIDIIAKSLNMTVDKVMEIINE